MEQTIVTFKSEKREIIITFDVLESGDLKYHVNMNPPLEDSEKDKPMDLTMGLANTFLEAILTPEQEEAINEANKQ